MTHFRLVLLACACALACSTTDDPAPGAEANAGATGLEGSMPANGTAAGVPGLDAPADVGAPPADAEVRPSGLASQRLVAGDGTRSPKATDTVRVNYSGWQTNGKRFDSSVARGMPAEFPLNNVIAGWTEGLQLMVEGEERRFWIPEALAYQGRQGYPSGMLVFDVQLIAILP